MVCVKNQRWIPKGTKPLYTHLIKVLRQINGKNNILVVGAVSNKIERKSKYDPSCIIKPEGFDNYVYLDMSAENVIMSNIVHIGLDFNKNLSMMLYLKKQFKEIIFDISVWKFVTNGIKMIKLLSELTTDKLTIDYESITETIYSPDMNDEFYKNFSDNTYEVSKTLQSYDTEILWRINSKTGKLGVLTNDKEYTSCWLSLSKNDVIQKFFEDHVLQLGFNKFEYNIRKAYPYSTKEFDHIIFFIN